MRIHKLSLLVATVALVSCAGAGGDGSAEEVSGLTPVQFDDIPVPDGMRLDVNLHESHSFEVGSFRIGEFHYSGTMSPKAVEDYMRQRMPLHDWRIVDETRADKRVDITFRRMPHRADCRIWTDVRGVTRLLVEVSTPREA